MIRAMGFWRTRAGGWWALLGGSGEPLATRKEGETKEDTEPHGSWAEWDLYWDVATS